MNYLLVTVMHRDDDGDRNETRLLQQFVQMPAYAMMSIDQDFPILADQGDQEKQGKADGTEEAAMIHVTRVCSLILELVRLTINKG